MLKEFAKIIKSSYLSGVGKTLFCSKSCNIIQLFSKCPVLFDLLPCAYIILIKLRVSFGLIWFSRIARNNLAQHKSNCESYKHI